MPHRFIIGRILVGILGAAMLAFVIGDLLKGEFRSRGHTIALAAEPGMFWLHAVLTGTASVLLLYFSVRGFGSTGREKP